MLSRLKIENIAIIELADITFFDGLNVLTGETGAGKSIIIDAINAVTGERTSRELIRTGAESGRVTAVFDSLGGAASHALAEMGIECDGTAVLSRVIRTDGKNICTINGTPCTVSMLRRVGGELINIHGQHDSQSLLQPENHCAYVDAFGGCEPLLAEYRQSYDALAAVTEEIQRSQMDEQEKARRIDVLQFQIDELESAALTVGESDTLRKKHDLLKNAQDILDSLNEAYTSLIEDGKGCDSVSDAAYELENAAQMYEGAAAVAQRVNDAKYELEDCCEEIRALMDRADCDPAELDAVEERMDLLKRLSRKYGADETDMLAFLDRAKRELEAITLSDERVQALQAQRQTLLRQTEALAKRLTAQRLAAAETLSERICGELRFLDMPNVAFSAARAEKPLSPNGCDEIEFLISPNVGEAQKPLAKIASGGELSRIMLAIKNVLSGRHGCDTMIFDEIDTGVSGSAARKIAQKLREVSGGRQVICVTHLAQIAAMADSHLRISKYVAGGKTYTRVDALDHTARAHELARIMGGEENSAAFLASAEELLKNG